MAVTLKNQQLIIYEDSKTVLKHPITILLNDPECLVEPKNMTKYLHKSEMVTFESNDLESFCFMSRVPNNCYFDRIDFVINRHTSSEILEEFLYFVKSCYKIKLIYIRFRTCSNTWQFNGMIDMLNILAECLNVGRVVFQYYSTKFFKFSENLGFEHKLINCNILHPADIFDTMQIDFQPC